MFYITLQTSPSPLTTSFLFNLENVYFKTYYYFYRQLEGEIAEEWAVSEADLDKEKLLPLIESIIGFDMRHNAEIQACDLLMEIDRLDLLDKHMDSTNYPRVCLYLCG